MKFKFVLINEYGILIDENPYNKVIGDIVWNKTSGFIYKLSDIH